MSAAKTGLALVVVIALILLLCALLKRFSPQHPRGGALKVIASQPVGQRERVVLIEVDDTWLVLGVAAGRVEKLYSLPAKRDASPASPAAASGFSRILARARGQTDGRDG